MREIFEEYGGIVVISLVGMSIISGLLNCISTICAVGGGV